MENQEIISSLVLNGDLSRMNAQQKVDYYNRFCESLDLNPLTQPFAIIKFQGKEMLYAKKDATEQLRKINGVSIIEMTDQIMNDILVVKVKVSDKNGRTDISTGAVNIKGLQGDILANAIMRAETKAKRRATLSICGLGILDESEIETLPQVEGHEQLAKKMFRVARNNGFSDDEVKSYVESLGWTSTREIPEEALLEITKAFENGEARNQLNKRLIGGGDAVD